MSEQAAKAPLPCQRAAFLTAMAYLALALGLFAVLFTNADVRPPDLPPPPINWPIVGFIALLIVPLLVAFRGWGQCRRWFMGVILVLPAVGGWGLLLQQGLHPGVTPSDDNMSWLKLDAGDYHRSFYSITYREGAQASSKLYVLHAGDEVMYHIANADCGYDEAHLPWRREGAHVLFDECYSLRGYDLAASRTLR